MTLHAPSQVHKFLEGGSSAIDSRYFPPEGPTVGRRGIKEYRAPEALILISADRDRKPLVCPSCGSAAVERNPPRTAEDEHPSGRVTLQCSSCGRSAVYIDRGQAARIGARPESR
jgi:transposase-like protein